MKTNNKASITETVWDQDKDTVEKVQRDSEHLRALTVAKRRHLEQRREDGQLAVSGRWAHTPRKTPTGSEICTRKQKSHKRDRRKRGRILL